MAWLLAKEKWRVRLEQVFLQMEEMQYAAVATAFALSVVLPRAGNLGGGGFMLVYLSELDKTIAIDYREKAPSEATRDLFLDENGNYDKNKARFSLLSAGVPGTVAGLSYALEKYGTLSWKEVISPSIKLAEEGFEVTRDIENVLTIYKNRLTLNQMIHYHDSYMGDF